MLTPLHGHIFLSKNAPCANNSLGFPTFKEVMTMKKYVILALSCVLAAGMFAGCRRNDMTDTSAPSTSATTQPTTAPTTAPTTRPTETVRPTQNTEPTQTPTEMPTLPGTTDGTEGNRRVRPRY